MDDAEYQEALKRYALDTLRDIERHINRELYAERWEWLQHEIEQRRAGVAPLPSPPVEEEPPEDEVYAGFLRRVAATAVDLLLVYLPLTFLFRHALEAEPPVSLALIALIPAAFPLYNIGCLARWGATPGKLCAGLRVVTLERDIPRLGSVLRRHLPDLLLGAAMLLALAPAVETLLASNLGGRGAAEQFQRLVPWWDRFDDLWDLWIWSECIVLLFNPTRRGFHDYLGATWVIRTTHMERFLREPPAPFEWRSWRTRLANFL